jgi:hypothetical protein
MNLTLAIELLMLFAAPITAVYATYRVFIALVGRFRPWEIGLPGFGGAVWLFSQAVHGVELYLRSQGDIDYALGMVGIMLMLTPKVVGMFRAAQGNGG